MATAPHRVIGLFACLAVSVGCGGGASAPDAKPLEADAGSPEVLPPLDIPNPIEVDTQAPEVVRAGTALMVGCTIRDASGEVYASVGRTPRIRVSPESSVLREGDVIVPQVAGELEVSCAFPDLMLVDATPARVRVTPGEPAELVTEVDAHVVEAGGTLNATCTVFDAFGNRIEDAEPTLALAPTEAGNEVRERSALLTRAGVYDASCALGGAATVAQQIEVVATRPARIAIARVPDEPVYGVGQVIAIEAIVTDRYDNVVGDAPVAFASAPEGSTLGAGRFRYGQDGTYVVTASVAPPTEGDAPLMAEATIVVNGAGPSIGCDGPRDGAMIVAAPGSTVMFAGSVDDVSGVEAVLVDGAAVDLEGGTFRAPVPVRFGINFVDIVARDRFGVESTRTCAFLASERYSAPDATLPDVLSLKLRQEAIDDGDRSGALDSLGDLLSRVLNSDGIRASLDGALTSANPLYPRQCVRRVLGACVFRLRVEYEPGTLEVGGPNVTSLTLVEGGLRAEVNLERIRLGARIGGTVDTRGTVTADRTNIRLVFDVRLEGGQPRLMVRNLENLRIDRIDTDFRGVAGFVINIIVDLFRGTVRRLIEDVLRDYVTGSFDQVLEGVFGGLDISTLGTEFRVPRLDGSGDLAIDFGVGFSSWSTRPERMLVGIGTRFGGPVRVAYPTEGVAFLPLLSDDPETSTGAAVAVQVALFNQLLHALWRGGLLESSVGGAGLGGGFPEGVQAELRGALPPVAVMRGEEVELGIGALSLSLIYPGLFDEPLQVTLGALASTDVRIEGSDLRFDRITVRELRFSTGDVSLDAGTRDTLERFLRGLVQRLVDGLLNDALPALPIPGFALPADFTRFGIPAGTELGLREPALAREPQHFVLRSRFGSL